jgi:protein-S-isoprenylcysteine O-methyltransferase Ste14
VARALQAALYCVFGAVALTWVVMAARTKRTVARGRGLYLIAGSGVAVFVLAHALLAGSTWARRLWVPGVPASLGALALGAAGAAFALWARFTIAGNWSGAIVLKEGHQLVTWGPYALARHPIYTGFVAMFAAGALVDGQVSALVALSLATLALLAKARAEERLLATAFPEEYPAYRARVKAIIPYVA